MIFFSSSSLILAPIQAPSKDIDSDSNKHPNDYVTANIYENETFESRDPGMSHSEIQPYAALVAGPSRNNMNHDYCNVSAENCRLV